MKASRFLQKHTYYAGNEEGEEATSLVDVSAKAVSSLIGGLSGSGTPTGDDDEDSSASSTPSMRHRQEMSRPYSQRLPKQYGGEGGAAPCRRHGDDRAAAPDRPGRPRPLSFFRGLVSPRATDMQRLLWKLDAQFRALERDLERYARVRGTGDPSAGAPRREPSECGAGVPEWRRLTFTICTLSLSRNPTVEWSRQR